MGESGKLSEKLHGAGERINRKLEEFGIGKAKKGEWMMTRQEIPTFPVARFSAAHSIGVLCCLNAPLCNTTTPAATSSILVWCGTQAMIYFCRAPHTIETGS